MSDLKHRTPEQLRSLVKWCEEKRAENDLVRKQCEAKIRDMEAMIKEVGKRTNNIQQKEVWARKYLAEKELGLRK